MMLIHNKQKFTSTFFKIAKLPKEIDYFILV